MSMNLFSHMKPTISASLLALVVLATPLAAQAPDSKDDQRLLEVAKEVQAQQAQIATNQAKIDAKLADIAEAVRVARIFSGREK
jgi:hypothetical protein